MERHAYLIMAHGNLKLLEYLIRALDDERNDIYIHIDKKVERVPFDAFSSLCQKARLEFTPQRLNVIWGDQTQVLNEMALYKLASKQFHQYYHLLSGVDIPLKKQDDIYSFFRDHLHKNFISCKDAKDLSVYDYQRLSRFCFSNKVDRRIAGYLYGIQNRLGVDRFKKYHYTFTRGNNWCSLTHDAVKYLVSMEKTIVKMTRFSVCADEVYKQVLLYNSPFAETIYKNDKGETDDLRLVDWKRRVNNSPHIFTIDDYEMIIASPKLFARKFDEKVDMEIVEKLYQRLRS